MIRYKVYQNKIQGSVGYGRWYARTACDETVGLEKLAEHMANHNTPYSQDCIHGVLRDGKAVKLDDLAIFSAGISTSGAKTAKEFTVSGNVRNVHLRARATGRLRTATLTSEAKKKEVVEYTVNMGDESGSKEDSKEDGGDVMP